MRMCRFFQICLRGVAENRSLSNSPFRGLTATLNKSSFNLYNFKCYIVIKLNGRVDNVAKYHVDVSASEGSINTSFMAERLDT